MKLHLIERAEVGTTPVGYVEFNVATLPAEYVDLVIYMSARINETISYYWESAKISFNNNSGTWRCIKISRNNAAPYGAADNSGLNYAVWTGTYNAGNSTANSFGTSTFIIPDWRASHEKPIIADGASPTISTGSGMTVSAARWLSSDPITSIRIFAGGSFTFAQHTSVTLYGVTTGTGGLTVS